MTEDREQELDTIVDIAQRALSIGFESKQSLSLMMDIERFHILQPLKLVELLNADTFTFAHDVGGIWSHYDRQANTINGCFLARTAAI
jgi:hypothetical protein